MVTFSPAALVDSMNFLPLTVMIRLPLLSYSTDSSERFADPPALPSAPEYPPDAVFPPAPERPPEIEPPPALPELPEPPAPLSDGAW